MRILFKVLHQKSHLNATFPLAQRLRDSGHEVIYAGIEQLRDHVEAQGMSYCVQEEDVYPYLEDRLGDSKLTIWSTFRSWWRNRHLLEMRREKYIKCDAFDRLLQATSPHWVLVDSPYTFFALSIFKHKIPFAVIESMTVLDRESGCPPLDTTYIPKSSYFSQFICALHWQRYFARRWLLGILGVRLEYNKRFVIQTAVNGGVDPSIISFDRYFHIGLSNVPEINLSLRELDFPRVGASNRCYFGAMLRINRVETGGDYSFRTRFDNIVVQRAQGKPVVYCSLGTAGWRYEGVQRFLNRVIEASRNASWALIVTIGSTQDFSQFIDVPSNIAVFQSVPQLEVLRNVDLMITHGGMNSITECILSTVPMLVYPGTLEIDQGGNAARVVYNQLGLSGRLTSDSSSKIRKKIAAILADKRYYNRVGALRRAIEANDVSNTKIFSLLPSIASQSIGCVL